MSNILYQRVKQRFEKESAEGKDMIICYHAYPMDSNFIAKLKADGFKLKPHSANKGVFIELSK